jgi:superfamily II DNA or RNA helicase
MEIDKDPRRTFTESQKNRLYVIYNGRCGICKSQLPDKWEADHIKPWASGGLTTIENGQPTCKNCNRSKGVKEMMKPRLWQERFLANYFARLRTPYLLVASPAAGKTSAALYAAKRLLDEREIERIIVVCPTSSLLRQWAKSANKHGVNLDPKWKSGGIKSHYDGICLTYAKVITSTEILNFICNQAKTLIILDEIHHAAEDLSWGDSIEDAFGTSSNLILSLSGTPFRGDNHFIPFVKYDDNLNVISDFNYSYGDAIVDKICRKSMFPALDGKAEFYFNGKITYWSSFDETNTDKDVSQLLRALLSDPAAGYLKDVLRKANLEINKIVENETYNAAGLAIGMDIYHANAIADLIKTITGIRPDVVTSDDPDSDNKILKFQESNDRWIVAVKKISEGVDIPRLRVGVYATNILTEVFFRQFSGRFWRRKDEDSTDEWSVIFAPRAPKLVEYMERIRQEIFHTIEETEERKRREFTNGDKDTTFTPLSSETNPAGDIVVSNETVYDYNRATEIMTRLKNDLDITVNEWTAAEIIKIARGEKKNEIKQVDNSFRANDEPVYVTEGKLRKICSGLVWSLTYEVQSNGFSSVDNKKIAEIIHGIWKNKPGNGPQKQASLDELSRKQSWVETGLARIETINALRRSHKHVYK